MDMNAGLPKAGMPFVLTEGEVQSLFNERNRFRLGELRRKWAEKALQVVLGTCHGIAVRRSDEVYQHATLIRFSMVKARRTYWGYYLLTVEYSYRGAVWQHVFRFERNSDKGLNGTLYSNSRRQISAK